MADEKDRFGLETAYRIAGVTLHSAAQDRLLRYVALLRQWQKAQNLVSAQTLDDVWLRHIADGLQLLPLIGRWAGGAAWDTETGTSVSADRAHGETPDRIALVDLGSGAGLPGLVVALGSSHQSDGPGPGDLEGFGTSRSSVPALGVTLVEANARKAAFLRAVSRETGVAAHVVNERIEASMAKVPSEIHVVTARALAPLPKLMTLAKPWLDKGATAFFHKGGEYGRELQEWTDGDDFNVVEHESVVDPNSRILQICRMDATRPRPAP